MEKIFNWLSVAGGFIGGILTFLFGDFDKLFWAFIAVIILDYITGIIKGVYTKTLSSDIGFKGILKKFLILIVVALAVILQRVMNNSVPLREIAIMFFLCNEGISILENAAEFIPIPKKVKEILLQLRGNLNTDEEGGRG